VGKKLVIYSITTWIQKIAPSPSQKLFPHTSLTKALSLQWLGTMIDYYTFMYKL